MRTHLVIVGGLTVLGILATVKAAAAAPFEAVAGFDVQSGPGEATTRTGFAGVGRALVPNLGASLVLARGEESTFEPTWAVAAGLVFVPAPLVRLRAWGVRSIAAPEGGAFTRWIVGPEVGPADGVRGGVFYTHETDEAGGLSQGGRAELSAPVARDWTASLEAAHTSIPGAEAAEQATVGLAWKPMAALEIAGRYGVARGAASPGFTPRRSALDRLLGNPPPEDAQATRDASSVAVVGVRVALP